MMSSAPASRAASLGLRAYGVAGAVASRAFFALRGASRSQRDRHLAFRSLMASQWLGTDQLVAEQAKRLQSMLAHCYRNVPYYRAVFTRLGAQPEDFRSVEDLAAFPLLTKEIIQSQGAQLQATGVEIPGVYRNHTGGSTGTPLTFMQDAEYFAWGMAELDRNYHMCGYRPGWRQAFLWGSDYDSKAHQGLSGFAHDLILNLRWYNTFKLSPADIRRITAELSAFRPQLMVGYVSALTMLATIMREEGLRIPAPRAIQTSAEVLTPDARRLLEETLGAKCFDRYGCREVGNIAHECDAHDGLHLLMENNVAEFVPVADGSTSQIVVTNLRNRAMPFIRYATGDTGTAQAGNCSCGRGLTRMKQLNGRVSDVIVAPSGRLIHGEFFTHLFYGAEAVRQFQVEQTSVPELIIRVVVPDDREYELLKRRVSALILEHGDPGFRLDWRRVDAIGSAASGKYRFTMSRVPLTQASSNALAV